MSPPPLYPVELKVAGRKCVVIGGGRVAVRKVSLLRECGAAVTVVAPEVVPDLADLAQQGQVTHVPRRFEPADLEGAALCLAATDDPTVNQQVYREATTRNIPVNVADQPHLCTFFVPATVRRGPVTVSVSTSGTSPALARQLREQLETVLPPAVGDLAELLGMLREEVRRRFADENHRRRIYTRMLESDALALLAEGRRQSAEEVLRACMW